MVQTLIKHLDQCINVNVIAEIKKKSVSKDWIVNTIMEHAWY